jgi:hypothetical protein
MCCSCLRPFQPLTPWQFGNLWKITVHKYYFVSYFLGLLLSSNVIKKINKNLKAFYLIKVTTSYHIVTAN